jgi:hypothetical protein
MRGGVVFWAAPLQRHVFSQGRFMSRPEPFTSLLEVAEIGAARTRQKSPGLDAERRLQELLAHALEPLRNLDKTQRGELCDRKKGRLGGIEAALNFVRPPWTMEYAAQALMDLPWQSKALRGLMIGQLLRDGSETAAALDVLAGKLATIPEKKRLTLLKRLLKEIGSASGLHTTDSPDRIEQAMLGLVTAGCPAPTAKSFSELALEIVRILKLIYPEKGGELKFAAAKSEAQRLMPVFGKPYQALLMRDTWSSYGNEFFAVLWDQLWSRVREPAAEAGASDESMYDIDRSMARLYQSEATLRTYFAGAGALSEQVRSALGEKHQALAREFSALAAQQKMLLQAIRNIAAQRNYKIIGQTDDIIDFDVRLHLLVDGDPALVRKVRVLEPPVVRETAGAPPEVLAQGEVEGCE